MYERFFGFEEAPFRLTPDPRYLFLSAKHKEALGHLVYGLEEGAGFVAITGEVGAGKTTLLRSFLSDPPENARYAYILNPVLSGVELLQEINHELGIREEGTQRDLLVALNAFLLEQKKIGNQVVLVIDEAQALGGAILEQLRMLSNFETETAKLLQIVLVGQPELRDLLARPDLVQLEQRITVRWHLGPLDRQETTQYVSHRLAMASDGRARRIFTPGALRRVFAYSEGIPRRINVLCHRALLVAYAMDSTTVTRKVVSRAIEEIESPRRKDPVGGAAWSLPAGWAPAGIAVVAAALLGGLGAWAVATRDRPGNETEGVAARTSPENAADIPRALDSVDRVAAANSPGGPAGPRVADRPLTPPLDPWTGSAPLARAPAAAWPPAAAPAAYVPEPEPVVAMPEEPAAPPSSAVVASEPLSPAPMAVTDSRWVERAALADAVRQTTPSSSAYDAVAALVSAWGADGLSAAEAASQALDLQTIASRRGLEYLEIRGNLNVLRVLNLPAILELDLGDGSGVHFAMLDRVDDDRVHVRLGQEALDVSHSTLSEVWFGQGHVLWYDVDKLGGLLSRGVRGAKVRRLHDLLRQAGVYAGASQDQFDRTTEEAVVEFQRAVHLEADGKVGPMTMIALYGVADEEALPRLAREPATTARADVPRVGGLP